MEYLVIKIGMIGISEGNGHPFSFSAIINGYSDADLQKSEWPVIYNYVKEKDSSEFGVEGVSITHAWTQEPDLTRMLCAASLIPNQVGSWKDMINQVDAVIIARDDYERHFEMAMPFLQAGKHVFVDKPLSLGLKELKKLKQYLDNGQLMSCSGARYAKELDYIRSNIAEYGNINLIRCITPNSWEKYGVHMLDAVFNIIKSQAIAVTMLNCNHASASINMSDGSLLQIDCLGQSPAKFSLNVFGSNKNGRWEINDNFTMFRRTLWHFIDSIKKNKKPIPSHITIDIMRVLIAGQVSRREQRTVLLEEVQI